MEPFYGRSSCLKSLALGSTRLAWPSYINWANQDGSQGSSTQLNCWSFTRWPDSFQPPRRCQSLWPCAERCLPRTGTSVGHCTWIALSMVSGSCHGTQRIAHYPVCHTAVWNLFSASVVYRIQPECKLAHCYRCRWCSRTGYSFDFCLHQIQRMSPASSWRWQFLPCSWA